MTAQRLIGIGRQVGALRALLSYGLSELAARVLIAEAKAAGRTEIEFRVPAGGPVEAGQTLRLRIMRGGHVDVLRVVGGIAP